MPMSSAAMQQVMERLHFDRNVRLNFLRGVLWTQTTLSLASIFTLAVSFKRVTETRLLLTEVLLWVPLNWLLFFLLERSGGVRTSIFNLVSACLGAAFILGQCVYHGWTISHAKACQGGDLTQLCNSYPYRDFRILAFVISLLFLLSQTLLIVAAARVYSVIAKPSHSNIIVVRHGPVETNHVVETAAKPRQRTVATVESAVSAPVAAATTIDSNLLIKAMQNQRSSFSR
jgi:hypothetical protein